MASLTQTVVCKGTPNLLITEGSLKILRDLIPPFPTKISYKFSFMEWKDHKKLYSFSQWS